jgi:hypothetical protein
MTGEKTGADEHKLIFDSLRELLKLKKWHFIWDSKNLKPQDVHSCGLQGRASDE